MLLFAVVAIVSVVVASAGVDTLGVAGDGCVVIISRGLDVSVRDVMSSMAMEMKSRAGELMPGEGGALSYYFLNLTAT